MFYDRLATKDAGKLAFLADGKETLMVWRDGKRVEVLPPEGMIIVDELLCQEKNKTRKRFVLAHEAGHIIMDLLNNRPITAAYNNEFDNEQDYSIKDLSALFDIRESRATSMGVALLMCLSRSPTIPCWILWKRSGTMIKNCVYFCEGPCEETLIKALQKPPALIAAGRPRPLKAKGIDVNE